MTRESLVEGVKSRLCRLRAAEVSASSCGDYATADAMFRDYATTRKMALTVAKEWRTLGRRALASVMERTANAV